MTDAQTPRPGGIIEKEGPIHVSNVMLRRPRRQQADPGRRRAATTAASACATRSAAGRRSTDGGDRGTDQQAARRRACASATSRRSCPALIEQVRLLDADAGAAPAEDHAQHGRRRRRSRTPRSSRPPPSSSATIAGQQPERAPRPQVDRRLQAARGDAGRRRRDAARRARMWEFLDRLISIAIPRIRDFRGLNPRSFDGRGNYSMGVREQLIFPEIDYDSVDEVRGLDITITTTAATDEEASSCCSARHAVRPGGPARRQPMRRPRRSSARRPPRPRPSRPRSSSSRENPEATRSRATTTPRATTPSESED